MILPPNLHLTHGNIVDKNADVLICPANPYLNLSGDVGTAFAERYGDGMQDWLHTYLKARNLRCVPQGRIVRAPACGSPYRFVLHAVAVDNMYDSSIDIVCKLLLDCIHLCNEEHTPRIIMPALATGYGRLTHDDFATGLLLALDQADSNCQVTLCMRRYAQEIDMRDLLSSKRFSAA